VGGPSANETVTVDVLPPPNDFTFGVKRNRRKGTASIEVEIPVGGRVQLSGAGIKGVGRETIQAGEVALPVSPRGKAKRRLAKKGFATVRFDLTFTPIDGTAKTRSGTVALIKRP
jgi:large repetitive protein